MKARYLIAALVSAAINAALLAVAGLLPRDRDVRADLLAPVPVTLVPPPPAEQPLPEPAPQREPPPPAPPPDFAPDLLQPRIEPLAPGTFDIAVDLLRGPVAPAGGGFVFEAAELDAAPRTIVHVPPVYPTQARLREIEGRVQVRFLVDGQGQVGRISIVDAVPPGLFEESVLRALPSWRFDPGRIDGRPVASWVVTTIRFEMSDEDR